jgi:hypothetical protein
MSATLNQKWSESCCPFEVIGSVDPDRNVAAIQSTNPIATTQPIFPAGTPFTTSSPFLRNRNPCQTEYAVTAIAAANVIYISHSITSAIAGEMKLFMMCLFIFCNHIEQRDSSLFHLSCQALNL